MDVLNIKSDYVGFVDSTQNGHIIKKDRVQTKIEDKDKINIILKLLLLSIPIVAILLFLIGLIIWTILQPVFSKHLTNGKIFIASSSC